MVIKTRWLWAAWGPNYVDMRGWQFGLLLFPRPEEAAIGMRPPALLSIEVNRSGPSLIFRRHQRDGIDSGSWTGLEYDWPPRVRVEIG